jgi:hypothetical protein
VAGAQVQKLVNTGAKTPSSNLGLTVNAAHPRYGNFSMAWSRQYTAQPTEGTPKLTTANFSLDWTKNINKSWDIKGSAKLIQRNMGDASLRVDERTVALQGAYKW